MNLLEQILAAQNGGVVKKVAESNGIDPTMALATIAKLLPALASGFKGQVADPNSPVTLEGLLGALQQGKHGRYLEDPNAVAAPDARSDGNELLARILGTKDNSRALADQVSQQTGLDTGIIKRMLPQVATLVLGALTQRASAGGGGLAELAGSLLGGGARQQAQAPESLLTAFLDQNNDGSVLDDVMRLAAKFLTK
ncbi:MAG: DUF937 domain-containing protein [Thiotrichales bacterium]